MIFITAKFQVRPEDAVPSPTDLGLGRLERFVTHPELRGYACHL